MDYRRLYEKSLIIAPRDRQDEFLSLRKTHPTLDFKLIDRDSFVNRANCLYDERALIYLLKKGKGYHEAKELLKAFAHFEENKAYTSPIILGYLPLFKELLEQGLLYKDPLPDADFANRHIVISGYHESSSISKSLSEAKNLDTCFDLIKKNDAFPVVNVFSSAFLELHAVFNRIASLLDNGVDISSIYLANVNESYAPMIETLSNLYGFAVDLPSFTSLYATSLGRDFLRLFDESDGKLDEAIDRLKESYSSSADFQTLYLKIKYFFIPELDKEKQKEIYVSILKELKTKKPSKSPAVRILNGNYAKEDSHVFYLDFSLESTPKTYNGSPIFDEAALKELGIPTSLERNTEEKKDFIDFLRSPSIEMVTFHEKHIANTSHLSSLVGDLKLEVKETKLSELRNPVEYSEEVSKAIGQSLIDKKKTYGLDDDFLGLYGKDSLTPYNNAFDIPKGGVSIDLGRDYAYSYSSIDEYYNCPFSFYVSHVLRIKDINSRSNTDLGTVAHATFDSFFKEVRKNNIFDEDDLQNLFDRTFEEEKQQFYDGINLKPSEIYLLNLFKRDLFKVALYIFHSEERIEQPHFYYEKEVFTKIGNVNVRGKLDKVITFGNENVAIIDYKTYEVDFSEDKLDFGLGMQLPIYSLLRKGDKELDNLQTAGLFISPIILSKKKELDIENASSYGPSLRLQGIFLDDKEALKSFGITFTGTSDYILGTTITSKGTYKNPGREKTEAEFESYEEKAKIKIEEADKAIHNVLFPIYPASSKKLKADGCLYCNFRAICYLKASQKHILVPGEVEEEEDEFE